MNGLTLGSTIWLGDEKPEYEAVVTRLPSPIFSYARPYAVNITDSDGAPQTFHCVDFEVAGQSESLVWYRMIDADNFTTRMREFCEALAEEKQGGDAVKAMLGYPTKK
jgi:hypothetical protein